MGLRGPLRPKNNLANIVSFSQSLRGQRRANTPVIKTQTPCSSFHLPLLPHTDRKCWPHQILEVIGYPLKHLNTTWRSNTQKHTHTQLGLYHPPTCVCSYLNHAGWGPWVQGRGMSEEEKKMWGKRIKGKVGGLLAEVRVKAVNVFMEKWGLTIWPNQGLVANFMAEGRQLWKL